MDDKSVGVSLGWRGALNDTSPTAGLQMSVPASQEHAYEVLESDPLLDSEGLSGAELDRSERLLVLPPVGSNNPQFGLEGGVPLRGKFGY